MNMSFNNRVCIWVLSLTIIVAVALTFRLSTVIFSPERERFGLGPFGDSYGYHITAYNLIMGRGFSVTDVEAGSGKPVYKPTFTRGPGYPFFIYLVYTTFPDYEKLSSTQYWHIAFDRVRIAQCAMDSLCCVLIFLIVRLLCPASLWLPLISAALYSFAPYNIYYTRALLTETLTAFLVTLFVLLSIAGMRTMRLRLFFYAGLAFGLVLLTRSEYMFLLPVFATFIFLSQRLHTASAVKASLVYMLSAAIIVAPWSVRNLIVLKKPILLTAGRSGEMLYTGTYYNKKNWRGWDTFPDDVCIDDEERQTVHALFKNGFQIIYSGSIEEVAKRDKTFMELAARRFRAHPLQAITNWMLKIPLLWYQGAFPIFRDPEASGLWFAFYFAFACYAFATAGSGGRKLMWPVVLLFIYLTIIFIPLYVEPRYSVPLMPSIICLAGIGAGKAVGSIVKGGAVLLGRASRE